MNDKQEESSHDTFTAPSQLCQTSQHHQQQVQQNIIGSIQSQQPFPQPAQQSHASSSSSTSTSMVLGSSCSSISSKDWNFSFGSNKLDCSLNKFSFTSIQEGSVENSFASVKSRETDNSLDFLSEFAVDTEIDMTGFDSDLDGKKKKKRKKLKQNPGNVEKPSDEICPSVKVESPSDPVAKFDKKNSEGTISDTSTCDRALSSTLSSTLIQGANFPPRIDARIIQVGDHFHIVPINYSDIMPLVEAAQRNETSCVNVTLAAGLSVALNDGITAKIAPSSSSKNNSTLTGNPKHIYKTACDTYRVQVGKSSRKEKSGKFSRNARSETDALWLCELALIISDCPPTLEDIVRCGNYKYIQQRGLVTSPQEFAVKLLQQAELMHYRGLLRAEESQIAVFSLRSILPPTLLACVPSTSTQEPFVYMQPASNPALPAASMMLSHEQQSPSLPSYPLVPGFPRPVEMLHEDSEEVTQNSGAHTNSGNNNRRDSKKRAMHSDIGIDPGKRNEKDQSDLFEFL